MHIATWILIGLLVGGLARFAGRRTAGPLGELALGCLGAVGAGWTFHMLRMIEPEAWLANIGVSSLGALTALALARLLLRSAAMQGAAHTVSAFEHQLLAKLSHVQPVARDANRAFDEQLTLGQRTADRLAAFGGSWAFLGIFAATLLGWLILNTERARPFDPYPFILLNLVLSCLAAVQAPVILMAQNRQVVKDRLAARLDYEVNLKAELEILALHEKLDGLREKAWGELLALQQSQLALLARLEERSRPGAELHAG